MIYAGDQWIQYPVKDLYDKAIMLMSIAAARDMYEKGLKLLEDFNTKYGDFMSPIAKDMDWYNQNVTGKVRDTINNLYANGIDPLRSAEGRAAVAQLIYSMPTGEIAKLRLSAETAKEYLKSFGDDTNLELEKFLGRDLSNWSTLGDKDNPANGIWGYSKASKYLTIDLIIEPIIKNLDYSYDEARTKQANDGNDYYTVSEDRIRATIADAMEDLTNKNTVGGYYYNLALQATGGDPDKARALYTEWLVNRGKDHLKEKFTPNEWKKMAKEHQYRMAEINHRASLRGSGNGNGSQLSGGAYDFATDIYDKGLNNIMGMPGGHAYEIGPGGKYLNAEQFFHGTDKLVQALREFGKKAKDIAKSGGNRWTAYRNKYTHTTGLSGKTFAEYTQRNTFEGTTYGGKFDWKGKGVVRLDEKDLKRIRTISEMITNTAGYTSKLNTGNEKEKELLKNMKANPSKYLIGGNNIDVYGAFNKPGRYQNDFIISVYDSTTGKKVGDVAYDSYINSSKTTGGLYESNNKFDASSARELSTRNYVTQGSTNVNKLLSTTRKQQMPMVGPYVYDDEEDEY